MLVAAVRRERGVLVRLSAAAKRRGKGEGRGGGKGRGRNSRGNIAREEEEEVDMVLLEGEGYTISEFATKIGKPAPVIITYFFAEKGMPLAVNDTLDRDLCNEVAEKYGVDVLWEEEKEVSASDRGFLDEVDEDAEPRPPVVTVMGHVDHGKTTLLDTIRKRSVAATEAGGITQRIGAYTVKVGEQKVTFIDTPGHEAFTAMRARGAQVTDIAVLVVAADDGVMPQTQEAVAHARAAEVPIVVAINKIDVKNANPDKTRQALAQEGVLDEQYGGDVPMVEVSAKKNMNIDQLLEIITLTAEVGELKAKKDGPAAGIVLESTFESRTGVLATLLVQRGKLRTGANIVVGTQFCRIKAMLNEAGKPMKLVEPSGICQVIGFQDAPAAGDQFEVFPSVKEAKAVAEQRARKDGAASPAGFGGLALDTDSVVRLAIILKTDAQGSVAAVKYMFQGMKDSKYLNIRWVMATPGPITISDIELAATCPKDQKVMVLGFNSSYSQSVKALAKSYGITLKNFKVIYELFETVKNALEDQIGLKEKLTQCGEAEVLAVFKGRDGNVAGAQVIEGTLVKGNRIKVFRMDKQIAEGTLTSLRVQRDTVDDVEEGSECGFGIEGWDSWQDGDLAVCFDVAMIKPDLVGESKNTK